MTEKDTGLTCKNIDQLAELKAELEHIDDQAHQLGSKRAEIIDRFAKESGYDPDYAEPGRLLDPKCNHESTAVRDTIFDVDPKTGDESEKPEQIQLVCDTCGKIMEWTEA